MTREEAEWIMHMCRDRDAQTKAERDAFDMAIEALKQEPRKGEWIRNDNGYERRSKMTKTDKEIRGWKEIIIETEEGELLIDITHDNYIAKDGYSIRLVPSEGERREP